MSINWVMLAPTSNPPYTPLPNEQTLFKSPPRIALSISLPTHYPGKQQQAFSLTSSSGLLYLTNQRIIYLPSQPTDKLQSFATPVLNLYDSHVTAPFFGPNIWQALLRPVSGGGIPTPPTGVVELKFTFKDGGAFDFHTNFERVKERLDQAMEAARISGNAPGGSSAPMNGVNVNNVDLDDLPAYRRENEGPVIPQSATPAHAPYNEASTAQPQGSQGGAHTVISAPPSRTDGFAPPSEPPPGYEEAQMAGLQDEAERRLNEARPS